MPDPINHPPSVAHRKGVVLLAVLFVVMAVTVISLGILARGDVELACGQNMTLRAEMDQLAASGLQHARGLVLHPQEVSSEYWTGAADLQLDTSGRDFYDVSVGLDESDPNDRCNYTIQCKAYRRNGADEVGCSRVSAGLRLDPCIALWTDAATTITSGLTIHGDVRCGGSLVNCGSIDGDVFADAPPPDDDNVTGQFNPQSLSLAWPNMTVADFTESSCYAVDSISVGTLSSDLGPYDPEHIFHRDGDLVVTEGVAVHGMLLVDADLTIRGNDVTLTAAKNVPALYVTGDLVVEDVDNLQITGLAVVDANVCISAGASGISVRGGLFSKGRIIETVGDSLAGDYAYVYGTPQWDPAGGAINGALRFDGADDFIEVQNESPFDITGAITVAAWIKVAVFNRSYQAIVTKGDSAWRIQRWSNTDRIEFACTGLTHNTPHGTLEGNANVNDGQWHHVAGVYDGARIYLYVDGDLDVSEATSGAITANNYEVMIGRNAEKANRLWNGWIDDVRIYNRGLTAEEITLIKSGDSVPGLVSQWRLDEPGADVTMTADPPKAAVLIRPGGSPEHWSPAAGAFFKNVCREQP